MGRIKSERRMIMEKVLNQILETQNQILKTLQQHGEQLQSLEKGQHRLESRLESEAFDKISTLFDGHSLRGDQIERLQIHLNERLDSIENDTRYLVTKVVRLEKMAK